MPSYSCLGTTAPCYVYILLLISLSLLRPRADSSSNTVDGDIALGPAFSSEGVPSGLLSILDVTCSGEFQLPQLYSPLSLVMLTDPDRSASGIRFITAPLMSNLGTVVSSENSCAYRAINESRSLPTSLGNKESSGSCSFFTFFRYVLRVLPSFILSFYESRSFAASYFSLYV